MPGRPVPSSLLQADSKSARLFLELVFPVASKGGVSLNDQQKAGQVLDDAELDELSGGQVKVEVGIYIDPPGICVSG